MHSSRTGEVSCHHPAILSASTTARLVGAHRHGCAVSGCGADTTRSSLMNAPTFYEVLLRSDHADSTPEPELNLATEGVLRYVWESSFGPILIEVIGDEIYVNREKVDPA